MKRLIGFLMSLVLFISCFPSAMAEATPAEALIDAMRQGTELEDWYDRMSAEMQKSVPYDSFALLWTQLEGMGGAYQGLLDEVIATETEENTVYTCNLDMAAMDLTMTLVLDKTGAITGLGFTPIAQAAPQVAVAAAEEEVTVGEAPWALSGTLTMPASDAPVPAVVLVHGSGPSDRDETVGATKLFRDLAATLSDQGIAVLRYDKRTYVYGKEIVTSADYPAFTVEEESIQDAIAAGRLLAQDDRIDAKRIFVLGHSLGAILAPRIVSESDGLFCGMILACGTNASMADVMLRQNQDAVDGIADEAARQANQQLLDQFADELAALPSLSADEAKASVVFGNQPGYYFWEMAQQPSPAEFIKALALPTLLINGDRDFQVNAAEGREGWEAVLDTDVDYLSCLWADVNHLLMKPDVAPELAGTTGEYQTASTLDAEVGDAIASFINDFILNTEDKNQ